MLEFPGKKKSFIILKYKRDTPWKRTTNKMQTVAFYVLFIIRASEEAFSVNLKHKCPYIKWRNGRRKNKNKNKDNSISTQACMLSRSLTRYNESTWIVTIVVWGQILVQEVSVVACWPIDTHRGLKVNAI